MAGSEKPGIRVTGTDKLRKALFALPKRVRNKALRKAARPAAKILAAKARELAPKAGNELAKSIKVRARPRSRKGVIGVRVITENDHAGAQEYGTSTQEGTPYLRPAIEQVGQQVIESMSGDLGELIEQEARKLN